MVLNVTSDSRKDADDVRVGTMRFEEDQDGARWIDVGSRWYDEVRDVYEKFEITGGDVDGLRRVVEICGSRTMVIATRDDNDIRRAMGSRARAWFEEVCDDSQNFRLRL